MASMGTIKFCVGEGGDMNILLNKDCASVNSIKTAIQQHSRLKDQIVEKLEFDDTAAGGFVSDVDNPSYVPKLTGGVVTVKVIVAAPKDGSSSSGGAASNQNPAGGNTNTAPNPAQQQGGLGGQDWQRDLLRECVEPNPGPSWDEVRKALEAKLGKRAPYHKAQLDVFEDALYAAHALPNEKDIHAFIDGDKTKFENTFSGVASNMLGFINEIIPPAPNPAQQQGGQATSNQNNNNNNNARTVNRTWAVASSLSASNFGVPLSKLLFNQLLVEVATRGCVLVQGHYRSGKSSHCEALQRYLNTSSDYFCVRISLSMIKFVDGKEIEDDSLAVIESIMSALRPLVPPQDQAHLSIQSALQAIKRRTDVEKRRFVVLWDEFQLLVDKSMKGVRNEVLEACRHLVHPSGDLAEVVYSMVSFGTFDLHFLDEQVSDELGQRVLSPFHRRPFLVMPKPRYEDMEQVVDDWLSERGQLLSNGIVDSWLVNSGSHLGVFSYIGLRLDSDIADLSSMTMQEWATLYCSVTSHMSIRTSTFGRITSSVSTASVATKSFIRPYLLSGRPIYLSDDHIHYEAVLKMATCGLFTRTMVGDKEEFAVSCPSLRSVVLLVLSPPSPLIDIALLSAEKAEDLVTRLLTQMVTESALRDPIGWKKDNFPAEVVFQSLIFADVKTAFKTDNTKFMYKVMMESRQADKNLCGASGSAAKKRKSEGSGVNERRKRADILISNGVTVVIELKSNKNLGVYKKRVSQLEKAIDQARGYAKLHNANYAIVLNIIASSSSFPQVCRDHCRDGVHVVVIQARLSPHFSTFKLVPHADVRQSVLQFSTNQN